MASRLESDASLFNDSKRLVNHKNTSLGLSINKNNPLRQPKSAGRWPNSAAIKINPSSYHTNNNITTFSNKISNNDYSSFTKLPHLD